MPSDITLESIQAAQPRIAPYIKRTPLERNETLSSEMGANVFLKYELFQKTGSFKVRGAFNKLLQIGGQDQSLGIIAVSGGNHAQAVAYAAALLGRKATIIMPRSTPAIYLDATRAYGAEILFAADSNEAFSLFADHQCEGWIPIHPFDDLDVIAGQGTIGLEFLEELPAVTDVIISIGGGGLISGISTAIKSLRPEVRIWGVETLGADCMAKSLSAGHPIELPTIASIARTLGAITPSERTFECCRTHLESVTVVSDQQALDGVQFLLERAKILAEPAAGCTLAALRQLRPNFTGKSNIILLLCGGNFGIADIRNHFSS